MLRAREDLVALRTSADHMEEKLKAEILFLKEQIQAEQCLKENLEDTLQLEIEGCKEEIGEAAPDRRLRHHVAVFMFGFTSPPFLLVSSPSITQTSWKVR